ncbi:MAG: hypothetical protein JRI68_17975 [Deltaproteobacteria bacterium]|nr:hypothetical protein [Deltaproteobacteria bacterium]
MAASLGLGGCGTSFADLCEDICDCEGCTDDELEECIEEGEELEQDAEASGCGDEFEEWVECIDDGFVCEDGDVELEGDCDQLKDCTSGGD